MCARNACGTTALGLTQEALNKNDIEKLFSPSFLSQIAAIDFCGAYGDPILAADLTDIINYVRASSTKCTITIFTNGGLHPTSWWENLATTLGTRGRVVFAIDGLKDTNHIYRRGVKFSRVIENARTFIKAGGYAQWDFIVFRHNEHQVEEARKLSKEIGFGEFAVKKTARFLKSTYDYVPELQGQTSVNYFPIYNSHGQVIDMLEPPSDPSLVNDIVNIYPQLLTRFDTLDSLFSQTSIKCRVRENRSLFVSASGHVFPCCWTYVQSTTPIIHCFAPGVDTQMYDLVQESGGFDRINGLAVGLTSAIESPLFEAIAHSWTQPSIAAGRQKVCARTCGVEFGAFAKEFQSPELIPGSWQEYHLKKKEEKEESLTHVKIERGMAYLGENGVVSPPDGVLLCDPLTLLVAYPSFQDYMVKHFSSLLAQGIHLAIGDVDDLKRYVIESRSSNPMLFGHIAGNECMQKVGKITNQWASTVFTLDHFSLCGAFGGDEVIIAASGITYKYFHQAVLDLAARLREGAPRPLSFATATTTATSTPIVDPYSLFRKLVINVDMALFNQKNKRLEHDGRGVVIDLGDITHIISKSLGVTG
jgi:GGDEF domain-containing protein